MTSLVERARRLAELAKRRSDVLRDGDPAARDRARQLLEHVRAYVLPRAAALEVPLLVVVNHLPPDHDDRQVVLRDLRRVLEGTRLRGLDDERIEIVGIAEGQLAALTEGLDPGAAAPVVARIDELAADRGRRLALARRALEGALAGLTVLAAADATDVERDRAESEAGRGIATRGYG